MNNKYKIMSCAIRYIKMLRKLWVQYLESYTYEELDYLSYNSKFLVGFTIMIWIINIMLDEFCKFKVEYIIIDLYAYRT